MNKRDIGQDHIIHKLRDCQERINEAEKIKGGAIDALLEARALFENLFELSPDALVLVNRESCIMRVNTEAERLFGYSRQELIGKDHELLVPDRFKEKHTTQMNAYMNEPRVRVMGIGLELRGRRKDGTVFAADIDLGPIEIGKEFVVLAVVRDATKRKRLEEELEGYRQRLEQVVAQRTAEFARANAELTREIEERRKTEEGLVLRASILDSAGFPVFLINTKGNFVYANEAAINTYGYGRDEFLDMNLSQLLRPEEASVVPGRLKEVQETGHMVLVTIHVRKDKSLMPVQVHHSLAKTAHGQFIVSVMRNLADEPELRLLFDEAPGAILVTDANLRLTSCAGSALDSTGLKPVQCLGMTLYDYLKGSSFEKALLPAHQGALTGTPTSFSVVIRRRRYFGWAVPLRSTKGEIIGTQSTMLKAPDDKPKPRRRTAK
ncbi:MAG: PAS domain S-box protein [Chloroflexi bacterium]|nr:PAS domain S-box protein [Chloroflexota bacterium]